MFKKIGVLLGGASREREISIRSGKAIAGALRQRGFDVIEIGESGSIEHEVLNARIDAVFIALHGIYGEDGQIQAFLEKNGIPYTGSGPAASRTAFNKGTAKRVFEKNGLLTPPWSLCAGNTELDPRAVKLPAVIKPALEGSSIGLTIVNEKAAVQAAFEKAVTGGGEVVIEEYIPGTEVTVGILGGQPLPVVQIKTRRDFYDFTAKYDDHSTQYLVPAPLDDSMRQLVQDTGLAAYNALGCRDFSRVDIIISDKGKPYVLEVNTIPGFTQTSLLPKAALAAGIDFDSLCVKILELCHNRLPVAMPVKRVFDT